MARRQQHSVKKRERERVKRERMEERLKKTGKERSSKPGGPEIADSNPSQLEGMEAARQHTAEAEKAAEKV